MNIQALMDKLTAQQLDSLIDASVWRAAKQKGLSWNQAATNQQSVIEAAALLSEYASTVLREMIRLFAAVPVDGERLLKEVRQQTALSGAECQLGIAELTEAGILFSVRKVWGESIYFLPPDCFLMWQQALFPCEVQSLPASEKSYMLDGRFLSAHRLLGRQLLSAFSVLARNGLELTAKGLLTKKTIAKMVQAVDFDERVLQPFELKWAQREHYTLTAAFILEAGCAFGVLYADQASLKWNEELLSCWLGLDEITRERELLNWCLKLLLPAGAESAHVTAALYGKADGQWYSMQHMEKWLNSNRFTTIRATAADQGSKKPDWYRLFHHFGWLELLEYDKEGEQTTLFRWKLPLGLAAHSLEHVDQQSIQQPDSLIIQPSGECIVEASCSFRVRWELELLAERLSDEHVTIYQLEASTIARALEIGRTRSSIQTFLEEASGGQPLSEAVDALLELWTSRACRTAFSEVVLLRCVNEQMAAFVQNDRKLAPFLLERLGPNDFIVDKAHISELRGLLQSAGYPPRKGIQSADAAEQRGYPVIDFNGAAVASLAFASDRLSAVRPNLFIYETYSLQHFELDAIASKETVQLSPQWERVPAMWTKQLRAYHHSTRKELIEHAMQLQTPVQLRLERGLRSFIPEKLEQITGGWAVVGLLRDEPERKPVRLTPDMWEEMRIVIPGQGDPI